MKTVLSHPAHVLFFEFELEMVNKFVSTVCFRNFKRLNFKIQKLFSCLTYRKPPPNIQKKDKFVMLLSPPPISKMNDKLTIIIN